MGLLDYFDPDTLRGKLKGLLGGMPISQLAQGRADFSGGGLRDALMGMPVFDPKSGAQDAFNAGLAGVTVYHGGPKIIKKIDPKKLQSRDSGFYGKGFYVAERPELTNGYGGRVSKFDLPDDAKVLKAGVDPEKSRDVAEMVHDWFVNAYYSKAAERGKIEQFLEEAAAIKIDPLAFKNAVDMFAVHHGYDAIRYSPGEVVIKNIGILKPVK